MNKILRYSFMAMLAMVFSNVMAEEVSWDWTKASYNDDASESKVTWSSDYVVLTLEKGESTSGANNYLGGTNAHTRVYKDQILTFTPVSGYTISKIEITATSTGNYTNYFKNATWTNGTATAADKVITITPTNGVEPVSAVFGSATRATLVTVTYSAAGDTREEVSLSFNPASLTVKIGKEFTEPTLTNEKNAPVVYSSSDPSVATVDPATGKLTLVAAGSTTIKATVPEDNTSYKGSASYPLTVKRATQTATLPYEEPFVNSGIGKFEIEDVSLEEGLSYAWSYIASYGMKASGYVSSKNHASESWLISPLVDLTGVDAAKLSFDHMTNFFTDVETAKKEATVWVREGENGTWTQLEGITYPATLANDFVNAGVISLAAYKDKTIQIGFKYTSTSTKAGTWEIKNFSITAEQPAGLSWSKASWTVTMGDSEITYPTLANPNNLTVTYTSSAENVATINEAGEITLVAAGETTITAAFAGDATYSAGDASFKLTVVDGNAKGGKYNPYTIAEVQALEEAAYPADKVWVVGYIAGCAANGGVISKEDAVNSNVLLTATATFDETDVQFPVAIPNNAARTAVNIVDHPENIGKEVKLYGKVQKYFGVTGMKDVTSYVFTGNSVEIVVTGITNINAAKAENAVRYNLAGQKVNNDYKGVVIMNGKKMLNK